MKNNIINISNSQHAFVSHPVVIANEKLEPEFFNPAAIASEYILLTPQSLKDGLSEANRQLLENCLKTGKAAQFTQEIGKVHKKEHRVEVKRHRQGLILHFYVKQSTSSAKELLETLDPNRDRMRMALHQLLTLCDLTRLTDKWDPKKISAQYRKQTMRAIRVMHLAELPEHSYQYMAVDAGALLDRLCKPAAEYVQKHTDFSIDYIPIEGECTLKCDPSLMRDILYSAFAALIYHTKSDISVNCSYMGSTLMINMITCGKADNGEKAGATLSPAIFGLQTPAEMIRRQQGELTLTAVDSARLALHITLPCAQLEAALKERLGDLLEENIDSLEMHFSEII